MVFCIRRNEIEKYSIVIPVFNSNKTLETLYNCLISVFESITEDFEIIFVDDGSIDNSWEILEKLYEKDKKVKIIQLMRNFGQHNALMCGFSLANGEYIITLDDDLQNPPEEIPKLIDKIKQGYDIVYGEYISKKHKWFRNIGSSFIQMVYKKIFNVSHNLTSFRIIKKELIKQILNYNKNYTFVDGLIAWNTKNIGVCNVSHNKRLDGKSGYNIKKLLTLAFNLITNFSIFPLQIVSILGFSFAILGFIMGIIFFLKKIIFDIPITGYTSLIISITLFSGIQLITLGFIGEYIGRIHLNINQKPQYNIRQIKINEK
ncbi:MAG: glycosyltransferase family 2 protein [bacterium]